jgi:hypothetical protein
MKSYRRSILSIFDQDFIVIDGVGHWVFYFSSEHRSVIPDIFHGVVLGWFIVRVRDKCGDRFFLLLFFLSFKSSLPIFGKWRVKGGKLLWVFFFFDQSFLSRFQRWDRVWYGVFSPKLFEGFFESEGPRSRWESKSVFGPIDIRVHGGQPGFSKEDHITVAHIHDVEFSINLDCKMTVVCNGIFGNLSVSSSDRERGGKAMGFDTMFLDKHPMDECSSCATVNNSSGLQ